MFFIEGRGGSVVPTFDIADVAESGTAFGATLGLRTSPRWVLMGEFDNGMHKDKATGLVDINTLHYMAKVGYSLTGPKVRGCEALVNLGAGAVSFDVEGAPTYTYFAINAGAKLAYLQSVHRLRALAARRHRDQQEGRAHDHQRVGLAVHGRASRQLLMSFTEFA